MSGNETKSSSESTNIFNQKRKLKYIIPMLVGLMGALFLKLIKKEKIILIGGNLGEKFDDNSKYMYLFLKGEKDYKVFWCQQNKIRLDSSIENFLVIGSVKSYIIYFISDIVYFTHSISTDICPIAYRFKFFQPFKVYLSHGVEGLKKRMDTKLEYADFYPCTNTYEYNLKNSCWGINKEKLAITGIARYDGLPIIRHSSDTDIKKILYMPTWREWYYGLSNDDFKETDFFKTLKEINENKRLNHYLNQNEIRFVIRLHPFFEKYSGCLKIFKKNKNFLISNENVGKLLISTDLLITDYSSVCWDFLYIGKPVIFFQYDLNKYLEKRGSYLKIPEELFGLKIFSLDKIIDSIRLSQKSKNINYSYRSRFFNYFDNKNCDRIFTKTLNIKFGLENRCVK